MKSVCSVRRNPHGPARFTGNHFRWVCDTPDGMVYAYTREDARDAARAYNAERAALIAQGEKQDAHASFYFD